MKNLLGELGHIPDEGTTTGGDMFDDSLDEFFNTVAKAEDGIKKMKEAIKNIRKLHDEILSSPVENIASKKKLTSIMDSFKMEAKGVKNVIDTISAEIKKDSAVAQSKPTVLQIKNNQKFYISRGLSDLMTEYSKVQTQYKDNLARRIERQAAIAGKTMTYEEIDRMIERGDMNTFVDQVAATEKAKEMLADIEDRHNDILNLEKNLLQVQSLFNELAIAIQDQGELLDRIDYNVEQAHEYVAAGETQLIKAGEYKKGAIKTKIIIGVCVAIVVIIIIIVAVTQSR